MTSKTEVRPVRSLVAILCTFLLLPGEPLAIPSSRLQAPVSSPQNQAPKISPEQLDSLVAPIALYPILIGCQFQDHGVQVAPQSTEPKPEWSGMYRLKPLKALGMWFRTYIP